MRHGKAPERALCRPGLSLAQSRPGKPLSQWYDFRRPMHRRLPKFEVFRTRGRGARPLSGARSRPAARSRAGSPVPHARSAREAAV